MIIKQWVANLGLRHQGVLVSAVRGPDYIPREDTIKTLVRMYRGSILEPHCKDLNKATSFMMPMDGELFYHSCADLLRSLDHYNLHFILHFIHAIEIVGYKAPPENDYVEWNNLYYRLCKKFHLNPETEEELDKRLNADESQFKNAQNH